MNQLVNLSIFILALTMRFHVKRFSVLNHIYFTFFRDFDTICVHIPDIWAIVYLTIFHDVKQYKINIFIFAITPKLIPRNTPGVTITLKSYCKVFKTLSEAYFELWYIHFLILLNFIFFNFLGKFLVLCSISTSGVK